MPTIVTLISDKFGSPCISVVGLSVSIGVSDVLMIYSQEFCI